MRYESLIDIIRTAAETALSFGLDIDQTPGTFVHARKADYSLQYDKPFPHINFFEPTSTANKDNPEVRSYKCTFLFNRNESDTLDTSERVDFLTEMDLLSRRFYSELDKNQNIEITGWNDEIIVRQYAARATGYAISCTITGALLYENCEPETVQLCIFQMDITELQKAVSGLWCKQKQ